MVNNKKFYYGALRDAVIQQLVIEQVVAGMDISGGTPIPQSWIDEAELVKRDILNAMQFEADGGNDPFPDRRPAVAVRKAKPPTATDN
jgi:hypothetical protein